MSPAQAIQAHLGGTQRAVAARLGVTVQAWNRYLKGHACPSADAVQGWCKAAGVSLVCDGDGWRVNGGATRRYWVFAGGYYYPEGGMSDLIAVVDDLGEVEGAIEALAADRGWPPDWWEVFDSEEEAIVSSSSPWSADGERELAKALTR